MTRSTISALKVFVLLFFAGDGVAAPQDNGELEGTIPFKDDALAAAVYASANALGRDVDATLIKTLRPVWNVRISDLSGLECFPRLELIDLREQAVQGFEALAGLSELRSLYLSGNFINATHSLDPLLEIPELRVLLLDNNSLDLSGSHGDVINTLRARGVYVSDGGQGNAGSLQDPSLEAALRKLVAKPQGTLIDKDFDGVTEIDLSAWCIEALQGIELVHDLERLTIRTGAVIDVGASIEALSRLDKLVYLDVSGTMPHSVAHFVGVPDGLPADLELVESSQFVGSRPCADERIFEFRAAEDGWLMSADVVDPQRTRTLVLSNNKLRKLNGIERFTELSTLIVPGNFISGIERLRSLEKLQYVDLRENDLDLTEGSAAALTIGFLREQGVTVLNDQQRSDFAVTLSDDRIASIVRNRLGIGLDSPIMSRQLRTLNHLDLSDLGVLELNGLEYAIGLSTLDLRGNFVAARGEDRDSMVVAILRAAGVAVDLSSTFHPDLENRFPNPHLIEHLFPRIGVYLTEAHNVSVKSVSLFDEKVTRDLRGLETLLILERVTIFLRPDGTMPEISEVSQRVLDKLQAKGIDLLTQLDIDFHLRNSLARATGSENPTPDAIGKLDELDVVGTTDDDDWSPVRSIDGLQSARHLRHLRISNREHVRDLSPIKGLINLETFAAPNNRIESLQPLKNAIDLTKLDVSRNYDVDPKPVLTNFRLLRELDASFTSYQPGVELDELDELEHLGLDGLGLRSEDIVFGALHDVRTLSLAQNRIDRAGVVAGYESLVTVDLSFNLIADASAAEWPESLESLTLDANRIADWDWLVQMSPLKRLSLTGNDIRTMAVPDAPALAQLEYLDLRGNNIDFENDAVSSASLAELRRRGVEVLTEPQTLANPEGRFSDRRLQWLFDRGIQTTLSPGEDAMAFADRLQDVRIDLYEDSARSLRLLVYPTFSDGSRFAGAQVESRILNPRAIVSLAGIEKSTQLLSLHVDGTSIATIPDLSPLQNLVSVNLDRNEISDLSGLKDSPLNHLDLDHNQIFDIAPLGSLKRLVSLDVADNLIQDISVLGQLTRLQIFDGDENLISDASPLVSNRNLEVLDLHGNKLRDYQFIDEFDLLREADLRDNQLAVGFGKAEREWLIEKASSDAAVYLYPQSEQDIPILIENGLVTVPALKNRFNIFVEESSDLDSWGILNVLYGSSGVTQFPLPVDAGKAKFYRVRYE